MQKSKTSNRTKNTSTKRVSPTDMKSIGLYAKMIEFKGYMRILIVEMTTL